MTEYVRLDNEELTHAINILAEIMSESDLSEELFCRLDEVYSSLCKAKD